MKIEYNFFMKTTGRGSPGMICIFGNDSNFNKIPEFNIRSNIKINKTSKTEEAIPSAF